MQLVRNLYDHFKEKARKTKVEHLCIGLRYTAVVVEDGGIGVAYTYPGKNHSCSMDKLYRDYEGEPAIELLEKLKSPSPLERSVGLALANALNYHEARKLPVDSDDRIWMDSFGVGHETRVATVGLFRPLMRLFEDRGAVVEVLDDFKGIGEKGGFYRKLKEWAQVLLLTSTSILNNSTEEVLENLAPGAKVIMLGPSTPMVSEAFRHLPVHVLAGTVPVDKEKVLKAVRHGEGAPVIHRSSLKVYTTLHR
jgi:uncharacterized protein (DUF4213/DUF364 family)